MASAPTSSVGSVVVDANVLIAICAREKAKFSKAETALKDFAARGSVFYAPGLIIGEVLYALREVAEWASYRSRAREGSPKFSSSDERYPAATTW